MDSMEYTYEDVSTLQRRLSAPSRKMIDKLPSEETVLKVLIAICAVLLSYRLIAMSDAEVLTFTVAMFAIGGSYAAYRFLKTLERLAKAVEKLEKSQRRRRGRF